MFFIIVVIFRTPVTAMFERMFTETAWSLATFNLAYNTLYTWVLLVFRDPLIKLVSKIVREKEVKTTQLHYIDERLLATPVIAIAQALMEVSSMASLAMENLTRAFDGLVNEDMSQSKQIAENEYRIDDITRALASFFIKLTSAPISSRNKKLIGGLHHVINDIERIGDHAVLLAKETNYMKGHEVCFLDQTKLELMEIHAKITALYNLCQLSFETRTTEDLKAISAAHQEVLDLVNTTGNLHIQRLSSNMYPIEVSKSLYTALNTLRRVSDHLVNIAFSILSDTGSKTEAFAYLDKSKKKAPAARRKRG
jgi:phosphate:Na+ symporter